MYQWWIVVCPVELPVPLQHRDHGDQGTGTTGHYCVCERRRVCGEATAVGEEEVQQTHCRCSIRAAARLLASFIFSV